MEGYTVPTESTAIYLVVKDREYRVSINSDLGYVSKMHKILVGTQIVPPVVTNPYHPDYFRVYGRIRYDIEASVLQKL